jgi:translation initiation factor IF-3
VMDKLNSKWVGQNTKVILIDENGNNLGVKTFQEAGKLGFTSKTKMVKVNENKEGMMIYRIANLEQLEKQKLNKKSKSNEVVAETEFKEIRFSMMISDHDVQFKEKKILELLKAGHVVKIIIFQKKTKNTAFEQELCVAIIKNILDKIDRDLATVQNIQIENRKQEAYTFVVPLKQREIKPKKNQKRYIKKKTIKKSDF